MQVKKGNHQKNRDDKDAEKIRTKNVEDASRDGTNISIFSLPAVTAGNVFTL